MASANDQPGQTPAKKKSGGKGGRPTKYDPTKLDQVLKLAQEGKPEGVIGRRVFGCGPARMSEYKKKYPQLSQALENGRDEYWDKQCGEVEDVMLLSAKGLAVIERWTKNNKDGTTEDHERYAAPSLGAQIFIVTNRKAGRWVNTQRMMHANDPDNPLTGPTVAGLIAAQNGNKPKPKDKKQ